MYHAPSAHRPTRTEDAYLMIKRRIICLSMAPGTPFTEAQPGGELQFSKTPVREALGRLQRGGLVELTSRSRYRVAPVTLKDVRELFSFTWVWR
jgi:DNA-binding GntR family transcriptional regulator